MTTPSSSRQSVEYGTRNPSRTSDTQPAWLSVLAMLGAGLAGIACGGDTSPGIPYR